MQLINIFFKGKLSKINDHMKKDKEIISKINFFLIKKNLQLNVIITMVLKKNF